MEGPQNGQCVLWESDLPSAEGMQKADLDGKG
jgi:hypothetical protein